MQEGTHSSRLITCVCTQEAAFVPLERLCEVGVNAGDVKKAKDAGFHTVDCLLMVTKKTLHQIKGLSEAKCDKMIEAARQLLPVRACMHPTFRIRRVRSTGLRMHALVRRQRTCSHPAASCSIGRLTTYARRSLRMTRAKKSNRSKRRPD